MADIDWAATYDEQRYHLYQFDQPGIFGEIEYWLEMLQVVGFGGWPLAILVNALLK